VEGLAGFTIEVGLEEELGASHSNVTGNVDNTLVGHGVGNVELGGGVSLSVLGLVVLRNEAELLLDVTNDFQFGGGGEGLTNAEKELLHVVGKDTASDFHLLDGVGDGETFEDGDSVGDTITSVAKETGGSTGGVEGHDSLEGNVDVLDLEGFEHDGGHLLSVGLGVTGSLGKEDTLSFLGGDTELVVEGVMPDLLHIFPGLDDTGSDGVGKVEDTSLLHGLITDVLRLLLGALHGVGVLWAADDGGEDGAGCVLTSETSLDHAGSVVDNYSLFFSHLRVVVGLVVIDRYLIITLRIELD